MGLLRHIIGFIAAFLFSVLGVVAMPMASTASHGAEFFPYQEAFTADHTNVHFVARAPPSTVAIVAVTGDVTVKHGGAFVTHGAEMQWASLNFGADLVATKRGVNADDVSFGRNPNQEYHTWRHIDDIGMDRSRVQNAILDDIPADLPAGPHRRTITVDGTQIEYRIFKFDDGTFNVGSIFDK